MMRRLLKWLFILIIFALIGLVVYAYVGPFLGADFAPPAREIRLPVVLDAS